MFFHVLLFACVNELEWVRYIRCIQYWMRFRNSKINAKRIVISLSCCILIIFFPFVRFASSSFHQHHHRKLYKKNCCIILKNKQKLSNQPSLLSFSIWMKIDTNVQNIYKDKQHACNEFFSFIAHILPGNRKGL